MDIRETNKDFYDALLKRINDPDCFSASNGITVTECWDGFAQGELVLTRTSMNPRGIVHGGCVCTLMDTVAGIAVCTGGRSCVTLNCTTNFISAGVNTKKLYCQGHRVKDGKTIAVYNAAVTDDTGRVVASGTYTYYLMDKLPEYKAFEEKQAK